MIIHRVKEVLLSDKEIQVSQGRLIFMVATVVMLGFGWFATQALLADYQVDARPGPQKVISFWQHVVEAQPENSEALIETAIVYYGEKKYGEALELLNKAENLNPRSRDVYFYLGLVYQSTGKKVKAKENFSRVLELYSTHYLASYQLGLMALEEKQWQTASSYLEKAIKYAPAGSGETYYRLGIAYEKRGLTQQARGAYDRALSYQPDHQQAKLALTKLP